MIIVIVLVLAVGSYVPPYIYQVNNNEPANSYQPVLAIRLSVRHYHDYIAHYFLAPVRTISVDDIGLAYLRI